MATALEARRADDVEQALKDVDVAFLALYGPDMATWSRGVRGEYLETLKGRRTGDREARPLYPRKSSAGRRRRHAQQLGWRISQVAPGAATILVTPIWMDGSGSSVRHYLARALDADGQIIKFVAGGSQRIASLLQAVYPGANWDHPLTWNADTNTLTDRISQKQVAS